MNKDHFIIIKDRASTTMLDIREISSVTTDYLLSINEMVFTVSMKNGDKFKTKDNIVEILDEHDKFLQSKSVNISYALWIENYDNIPPVGIFESEELADEFKDWLMRNNDYSPNDFKIIPYKLMTDIEQSKKELKRE